MASVSLKVQEDQLGPLKVQEVKPQEKPRTPFIILSIGQTPKVHLAPVSSLSEDNSEQSQRPRFKSQLYQLLCGLGQVA